MEKRVWMTLAGDYKKRGAALLHQQCWCFGFDVRHDHNGARRNLLLEMGFSRTPPPEQTVGATTYSRELANGERVHLWGFGFCFECAACSIFVSRFAFWPRVGTLSGHVWSPKQLTDFRAPRRESECLAALHSFERALFWLAQYEREVAQNFGLEHRERALEVWAHVDVNAASTPRAWEKLALDAAQSARLWHRENNKNRELPLQRGAELPLRQNQIGL